MRTAFTFGLLVTFLSTTLANAAEPLPYKVGTAKVDITPVHAIRLNGFGFRRTESEGTYHKIHARALAIDDGKAPVVLMTVDVLGIPADVIDEVAKRLAKKAGLKPERLAITATHSHTGPMITGANPTLFGVPIPKEHQANIDKYTPVFLDKLEEAALSALKDMKPAKLEWGVGKVGFAMNRRTKNGPTDHDLPVLIARDEKGKIRATYLNYACHCVTLSHNKIGGDWAGFAAAAIEDNFEGAVALVAIGGGADQNPSSGVTGAKEDVANAQGRDIAAEVRRLSQNFLAPVNGEILAKVTALELPLTALPTRKEWEEKAKRMDAIGHHARVTLAKLDREEKLPTKITYPVQTWAFGEALAMVHLPGELVVDYPLRLKKELDGQRVWVTGYANNAPCYIPSERVLKEGGYEGGGAMIYYDLPAAFAPGLEDKIIGAVKEQIEKTFAAKFDPKKTGDTKPLSPQQSRSLIKTKPGLRVELVAAEPLVADPVAIAFGPDGKLWAAEMADYPSGKSPLEPGGRIVFLEDANGDGIFDKSTVFLDNLPLPTGVLPWRKGVLVCAAPDILFAEDTDGDGKADKVTKLYSGFGTENQQGRVNSLQYGLDGWVYGSCGLFGGNITCGLTKKVVALGDRDFRIRPDTGELESATGRTQQGRVRDDRGNWFGCDNSTLIWHYVLDDHYLRRNPFVSYPNAMVNVAPTNKLFSQNSNAQRFALSGPPNTITAACGLGIYRDTLLGQEYYGNAFTCEPVNLLVTRRVLKPSGSTFVGERAKDETDSEFLASIDGWFRPVHITTGPDGCLYVADMYRYLIEHPRWIPPADLAKIDIRAGAGLGRIYRIAPEKGSPRPWARLDKLDTAGLVAALDSPNGWQRDMAMMMLIWTGDAKAKEPLEKMVLESKNGLARMQALCTLDRLGGARTGVIGSALADRDPAVRQHALRLGEQLFGEAAELQRLRQRALELFTDADPHVRLQLALAFANFSTPPNEWKPVDDSLYIARMCGEHINDPYLTAAAVSSLNKDNIGSFTDLLIVREKVASRSPQLLRDLLATAAGIDNGSRLPALLRTVVEPNGGAFQSWQLAAAAGALDSLERQGKPWDKLAPELRKSIDPVIAFARKVSEKDDATEADLLAALPLLGRDPAARADDLKRLAELLAATRPAAVQTAAVTVLTRKSDASTPATLISAWKSATPALRTRILDALLSRPAWHPELLSAIEKGTVLAGQIDASRRQQLADSPDAAIRQRAEKLFAGSTNPDRQKIIDDYKSALALKGDKTRGKAVFAKSCSACHVLEGVGSAVGPDLSALANKSPLYLLSEILDPNRNLDSRYSEYKAVTKDDRTVSGILAVETGTSVTLRGQQAKEEVILRSEIQELRGTSKSLMPEGLEKDIAKQDMADLIAYLTANEPPHKALAGNAPAEITVSDNSLTLPATKCFVYGDAIVFEPDFQNIGYWNRDADFVAWRVKVDKAREFDVYLDYACANDSAGNLFAVDGTEPALRGKVATTGGWDRYALVKLGTIKLPAGAGRITFRADATVRNALLDLRTLYLVPPGAKPKVAGASDKPLTPAELAALILDDATPRDRREALVKQAIPLAPDVVRTMVANLPANDAKEEYRRIPWVWRVAIEAGRANDAKVLAGLLDASFPKKGEPLHDWQAVILGGGVINGLSLEGKWPAARLAELIRPDPELAGRWAECLKLSHAMADDEKVSMGTRYDALRIVALDEWKGTESRLVKYLAKSAHAELQQGAVSGLVDVDRAESVALLVHALPDLTAGNRKLAIAGLLRTPARATALLDAIEKGTAKPEWVEKEHRAVLLEHPDQAVRTRAAKLVGDGR